MKDRRRMNRLETRSRNKSRNRRWNNMMKRSEYSIGIRNTGDRRK